MFLKKMMKKVPLAGGLLGMSTPGIDLIKKGPVVKRLLSDSSSSQSGAAQSPIGGDSYGNRGYGQFRIRPDLMGMRQFAYNRNQTPLAQSYQLPPDLPQQQEFQGLYGNPSFLRFMQMYRGGIR